MAFYKCGKCKFIFQRAGSVDACPYCDNEWLFAATEPDIAEYEKKRNDAVQSKTTISLTAK